MVAGGPAASESAAECADERAEQLLVEAAAGRGEEGQVVRRGIGWRAVIGYAGNPAWCSVWKGRRRGGEGCSSQGEINKIKNNIRYKILDRQ